MVDTHAIFAAMDAALSARRFAVEDERSHPEAFGSRWRLYRRTAREALLLTWDGREDWLVLHGGVPWRELAIVRDVRESSAAPTELVALLLRDASRAPDFSPAI
jgi:hypothetical protein